MKLALIMLTALLMISLALIQVVIFPTFQSTLTEDSETWQLKYLTAGQIRMLANVIAPLPEHEREQELEKLRKNIGFFVEISSLDDHSFDEDQLRELKAGETVVDIYKDSTYQLISDNQYISFVLTNEVPYHLTNKAQRFVMGSLYLIQEELRSIPQEDWDKAFMDIQKQYMHPIELKDMSTLDLSDKNIELLNSGKIVTLKTEDSETIDYPADYAIQKVNNSNKVIYVGPFSPTVIEKLYVLLTIYYICFGLFILIPILLWLLPAWFSMKELKRATASLGQGKFSTRVKRIPLSQLNHLSQTYNVMAEKIQRLISSHKTLTNTVSHELRTPIARIEFNIELLRGHVSGDYALNQLGQIESSVDELNKLVSEMLMYARFDREAPPLKLAQVNVNHWINEQVDVWRTTHPDIEIQVKIEDSMDVVFDQFYMNRALNNLIKNAICYGNGTVVISTAKTKKHLQLSVEDNGFGVDYTERYDVFTPFYRSSEHVDRDKGGSGLGLSIVKLIMDWHNGQVNVKKSTLGGANFQLTLPNSTSTDVIK